MTSMLVKSYPSDRVRRCVRVNVPKIRRWERREKIRRVAKGRGVEEEEEGRKKKVA